jgi:hypothetical protein
MTASTSITLGVYVPTFTLSGFSFYGLRANGTASTTVYINGEYGFNGNVQLAVSGLPSGVTAAYSPNPATTSSTLTLTAGSTVAAGQYTLNITGTSGSQQASTTVGLSIY